MRASSSRAAMTTEHLVRLAPGVGAVAAIAGNRRIQRTCHSANSVQPRNSAAVAMKSTEATWIDFERTMTTTMKCARPYTSWTSSSGRWQTERGAEFHKTRYRTPPSPRRRLPLPSWLTQASSAAASEGACPLVPACACEFKDFSKPGRRRIAAFSRLAFRAGRAGNPQTT